MKCGDKVKVAKMSSDKALNLWGGYDDVSYLLGKTGTVVNVLSSGTLYQMHGIEFDDDYAFMLRERTGIVFSKNELELVESN